MLRKLYRTPRDIKASILLILTEHVNVTRTTIYHEVKLSWDLTVKYSKMMVKEGLIKELSTDSKRYVITSKGKKWLKAFQKLQLIEGK